MTTMCIAAANYLINRTNEFNKGRQCAERIFMTCKRLQKLLYFSDVEYMRRNDGQSMFEDDFFAWASGPVIPSVYNRFAHFQSGRMEPLTGEYTPLTLKMQEALDEIFERSVFIDTFDLVEESHALNGPWMLVYNQEKSWQEQKISKESIYMFYKNRVPLGVVL